MSNLLIDSIDDLPLDAGTGNFLGTNSRLRAALIQDGQLSQGDDNIIGETGMAQTRFPLKAINNNGITESTAQGLTFFDTRTTEKLIAFVNNQTWARDNLTGASWTNLSHTTGGNVEAAQLVDNLFFVDGASFYKWDGTTFTEITTFDGSTTTLPLFNDIVAHDNRIILSRIDDPDYNDDAIYASDLLDGDSVDATFSIRVGGGDGDPIKKVVSWHGSYLAVLKQKSTYIVNTSTLLGTAGQGAADPVNWYIEKVSDTLGCIAPRTAVVVGNDVWFLSRDGLTSLRRTKESVQRQLSAVILNTEVNDVFEDINWGYADSACAGYFNNRYYISIPIGTSQLPNVTLVYNMLTQQWDGKFTGTAWVPSVIGRSSFGNNRHLVLMDTTGNVYWQREEGGVYEGRDQLPGVVQTSGNLVEGEAYEITAFTSGDVFTNVGAAANAVGEQFVATGTAPTTWVSSTLVKYVFEDIDLDIFTKAWDFGYPVNFKAGFNLEIDFYRSHGTVDIFLVPDDDTSRKLTVATAASTTGNPTLPQTLPFDLSGADDKRLIYEIRDIEQFKELKCQIQGNGSEVKVRRVHLTAFLNTMEIDNT
jgi:hypothetical protein